MTFATLGLHPDILRAVADAGYQAPTPVQAQTIPAALDGRDLMVSSQTGSGKTAAFILPAIHLFATTEQAGLQPPPGNQNKRTRSAAAPARPRMLVLTPTRELALQVTAATDRYSTHVRHVNAASILGGMPYSRQRQALARNPEILVATPGRLMDHMRTGKIDWSQLELLVLDEADRMLDMGFIDAIDSIVASLPQNRQTMLFSATLEGVVGKLGQKITRDPLVVRAAGPSASHENIQQRLHFVDDASHKGRLLDHLLRDLSVDQALVFTSTKREADAIAERLASAGFSAAALHGDMQQNARNRTLDALRRGRLRVLVATDVAARGIDVPSITHVFNFDLPRSPEDYVHRIGRTGRAGRDGFAISLVHHTETSNVRSIERFTRQDIPVDVVPGYEPRRTGSERTRKPGSAGRPGRNAKAGDSKRGWHSKPSKRRNGDSRRSAPGHTSSSFR
jgi:superfamily II DNA/RNA helicase